MIDGGRYWERGEKSAVDSRLLKRAGLLYCESVSKRLVAENHGASTGAAIRYQILCKA